jgi:radical SAM/Cys-rich protein
MQQDEDFLRAAAALKSKGQAALTREEAAARRRSLVKLGLPPFAEAVARAAAAAAGSPRPRSSPAPSPSSPPPSPLVRSRADTLQLNVGLFCNQACAHCHVESSPLRKEEAMDAATARRCLELAARALEAPPASSSPPPALRTLDLTGGAPELHAVFRELVLGGRALGLEVVDRCNLTVLTEPDQGARLARFLADNGVRVVASLPCYTPSTVDGQRGRGVFERSIEGLRMLNAVGYGREGTGLALDLVYNPSGAFLAPAASALEPDYRRELREAHGVEFSGLIALNNMPIKRFADFLLRAGELDRYMALLVSSFNAETVPGLMCRGTVSVGWDGRLYDCDFNQQLAMAMTRGAGAEGGEGGAGEGAGGGVDSGGEGSGKPGGAPPLTVFDVESLDELEGRRIAVGSHCYGCTSGNGSGCQGATV